VRALAPVGFLGLVGLAWLLLPGPARLEDWIAGLGLGADGPLRGLALLRACLWLAAATLISEDLTCLAAGALVARGSLGLAPAVAACFTGILVGDVLLFLCGRWLGPRVLARAPCRWFLEPARVADAARWLERRGPVVIFTSRFLPGARLPTYFASGALGTSLGRFTLWFALAGCLWTPAVVGLAAGLGGGLERIDVLRGGGAGLLGTLLAGWLALTLARTLATWRGRAAWRVRLRRLARFEYWPIGVFYLPVFALALARALRGQGLVFTAANPALPHGGFVGESKRAIHALLVAAGAPLPRTLFLARETGAPERRAAVREFQREGGLAVPLVLKPDAGQRGDGVRILRDASALDSALESVDEPILLQEFVPGEEFGLFYVRPPGAGEGRLFSVTRKLLPEVVGDGRRTLERLILTHREHLPMAGFFLERNAGDLLRVPAAGERVALGELGTHCRGARFLDGAELATPALASALESIVRALPGFHFGRFDVRAASGAELARGRFTVLELNGVTSEAAHIYDPRFGLLAAWRSLLAQWRLAYAIGEANARAGARVSTLGELRAALLDYRALAARRARPGRDAGRPVEPPALAPARP
jgi:membrane protein DedA with SNARE-associated domain